MIKHLLYLKYIIRHKWFVFQSCRKLHVPLWRAIVHDWSKFLLSEWRPYVHYFYGKHPRWENVPSGLKYCCVSFEQCQEYWAERFDYAWNKHQKRQPHHWQHWVVLMDTGGSKALDMPEVFIREMVADWMGAGLAITGKMETPQWYWKNRDNMLLSHATRQKVEFILGNTDIFNPDLNAVMFDIISNS